MSNRLVVALRRWVDSSAEGDQLRDDPRGIDWPRVVPFVALHLGCLGAFWTGWSPFAVGVAVALFAVRMFAITAFYHRYFSHRAFRTSRGWQFVFAVLGASAVQRGPLWWAAHHRHHHVHSDQPEDVHSPHRHGFLWSHMGWFLSRGNFSTRLKLVPDLAGFRELRWLDRYDVVVPALLGFALYGLGAWLEACPPVAGHQRYAAGRMGLLHLDRRCCSTPPSPSTRWRTAWGSRRYATRDQSRNNFWLALLTFGEGWHNNHHHYPVAARQGFFWWELDLSWYGLRLLAALGVVRDLRPVPASVREAGRRGRRRRRDEGRDRRQPASPATWRVPRCTASTTITVFEAGRHVGGHTTRTRSSSTAGRYAVDTGFIVFNDRTYPNFIALLDELGVASQESSMSFSVRDEVAGLEYNGTSLNALFAQRRNLLRPSFLAHGARHPALQPRGARDLLAEPGGELPLGEYLQRGRYGRAFVDHYIVPMGAAIWSTDPASMLAFPARFFVRFLHNHGMLTVNDRPDVAHDRGRLGALRRAAHARRSATASGSTRPVERVRRLPGRRARQGARGPSAERFDAVFLACHSDQALALLADPSAGRARSAGRHSLPAQRGRAAHRHAPAAAPPPGLGRVELPRARRGRTAGGADLQHEHPAASRRADAVPGHAEPHGRDRPRARHPAHHLPPPAVHAARRWPRRPGSGS